jgi:hypothetical protein
MGSDEIAKLKAELHSLNCRIQAERNDEIRHALNRTRLENERAQALVKLMDAHAPLAAMPPSAPAVAKAVVVDAPSPPSEPDLRRKVKPDGLPPVSAMIVTALQATGKASRPVEIADYVRKRWWPTLATAVINTQAWHLAKIGKLTCRDGYYGLNGVGH